MNEYNIATITGLSKVKGIITEIGDYKVIMYDDIGSIVISDFFYGVEIASGSDIEDALENAEKNINIFNSDEYNKRMKKLLSEKKIDYPVN